jgi:hypothetical protein
VTLVRLASPAMSGCIFRALRTPEESDMMCKGTLRRSTETLTEVGLYSFDLEEETPWP